MTFISTESVSFGNWSSYPGFDRFLCAFYIDTMRLLISLLLLMLMATPAIAAGGSYYIGPDDGVDLRLAPRNRAAVSGHLDSKTAVEIIKRDRNWAKVMTTDHKGIKGWVPAGAVRKNVSKASSGSSSSFFSSFTSIFRSSPTNQKTAVLGVRGLESGDGQDNTKASAQSIQIVEWMDTLNVPQDEVASFIKEGELKP